MGLLLQCSIFFRYRYLGFLRHKGARSGVDPAMSRKKKSPVAEAADAVQEVDAALTDAALPYQETLPVRIVASLSELGDQPQMRVLCGGVILAGLVRRDARMTRAGIRMIAAHTLATAAKNFVKRRVDRTRPRSRPQSNDAEAHKIKAGSNTEKEETSFPSGHSAGAAAVARAFTREYPELSTAAYAGAGLIALAQIPRCAHYPTDVGSGIAVGLAAEALVTRLFDPFAEGVVDGWNDGRDADAETLAGV